MKLSDIKNGETVYISKIGGTTAFRRRMEEMGFVVGQQLSRAYASPAGTPIVFSMVGQRVALRRNEAKLVEVCQTEAEVVYPDATEEAADASTLPVRAPGCGGNCDTCSCCDPKRTKPRRVADDFLTIALVGNPNCGKTALFNDVTGGHERTGNYAGVTVSSVEGWTEYEGRQLCVIDLPGTYSLRAFSPEEAFVANELAKGRVDVVINVLDATNLERNLLLTLQLKAMGLPMVGVLNMYDEFESSDSRLDVQALEERLGIPFIPTVANRGRGVKEVMQTAIKKAEETAKQRAEELKMSSAEESCEDVKMCSAEEGASADSVASKLQNSTSSQLHNSRSGAAAVLEGMRSSSADRHKEVHRLLADIYEPHESVAHRKSQRADRFLARTPLAYLLFFLIMGCIFYLTFEVGQYPMDWMESGVAWLSDVANEYLAEGWLRDLLISGVLGGVGSVIVFLPNILILYFFISILEDSGYLARTALLADPLLRRVGLHGKSFIPMLMGFGCSVPAVMATRTIESRKSRLITMMTLPFMSCSARLPVYTILAGAFFPEHAALVMLGLYALGIVVAFMAAGTLSHFFHRTEESHFVMEMPPYRRPVARPVLRHTWEKGRQYLRKMGGIILVASIVVWALGYFPVADESRSGGLQTADVQHGATTSVGEESREDVKMCSAEEVASASLTTKNLTTNNSKTNSAAAQQEQSYLGQLGHFISPVLEPLGYDWRLGVGILAGVGAKELMVSTLGVLYSVPEDADGEMSDEDLTAAIRASGTSTASGLSYLVFALLYFPCLATIAAIKGESGRWRYAIFTAVYTTLLAYAMAFIVYRLALLVL